MNEVEIIHINSDRWTDYKALRLEALKTEPVAFLTSYEQAAGYSDEEWQKRLDKSGKNIYFAQIDNQLVGMSGVKYGEAPKNSHVATIWCVYVKPNFRGQGIARKLLAKIVNDLESDPKIVKVNLEVVASQEGAKKLYSSLGFVESGVFRKEIKVDGVYYDEFLMEKILK